MDRVVFWGGKKENETSSLTKTRLYVEDFCSIGRTLTLMQGKIWVALFYAIERFQLQLHITSSTL